MLTGKPVAFATANAFPRSESAARTRSSSSIPHIFRKAGTVSSAVYPESRSGQAYNIRYPREMGVQKTLAANLKALMAYYADRRDGARDKPEAVAKTAKGRVGKSSLYDAMKDDGSWLRASQLDAVAQALKVPAYLLLYPDLRPEERPMLVTEAELEEIVLQRMQEMVNERKRLQEGAAADGRPGTNQPFVAGETTPLKPGSATKAKRA